MEPAAVKLIWSRSVEKRKLCYTTFIGDGDSKSFNQVCDLNLYSNTTVRKEVCLAHVTKRLKKTLCIVRKNTKNHSCIQHKLAEPKATYISSNYSTAILQHKRQSPATIANRLNIFLSHASGTHEHSPITHSANGDKHLPLPNNLPLHLPTSPSLPSIIPKKPFRPMTRRSSVLTWRLVWLKIPTSTCTTSSRISVEG